MKYSNSSIISKVKSALLCIQHYQWEQGCTAQAILDMEGLKDEVIRLCEAAVIRSAEDGRVGIMGNNEAVNDPAALGEALIRSARMTGSNRFQEAADRLYHYLKHDAPRTKDGILYHFDASWAKNVNGKPLVPS
jgi:rhamnogalacturonyl hydrolase YesR